ncbi:hypothetical protein E3O62_07465 [Cryobacterium sp. TMT2-15-1]|uniref:anti-sigma factor n=1 Tax=Cryobacterium sp. TMT2-15-1 TaxID=1259246 RepID=UPI00106B787C|nr:anti-sigma factor [Cryobacterium sp. TMT2-15-1]TFC60520.1 hypothetical protein E3O62_07465 [Cryobacterium sp. TMT2-15-1]
MSDNNRNDDPRNATAQNPGELAGAYALHALGAEEAAVYEEHLKASEPARIEAAELSDTAVALGLAAAPVQPSAGLRASLMAKLAATPQLAPRPAGQTAPATPAPRVPAPIQGATAAGSATERARLRWFQRPVGVLAAAAAAVALFAGGTFVGQSLESDQFEQDQAAGLVQITAAADIQRASATTADGQEATLVWSEESGLSALLVDDLPDLPSDRDYQLWYIGGSGAVPAGIFDSSGTGTVWRVLDGSLTAGDTIGVTVEPKGGSEQPTSDPILAIQSS